MAGVHFIGGEKGGVGKSMTARLLSQYLIDNRRPFIGFDADSSHSTFSRFYDEFSSQVNIEDYEGLDDILAAAERYPGTDLVVDLAAQTSAAVNRWINESDALVAFEELGHTVNFWHVMDDGADSMRLLEKLLDEHSSGIARLVVVLNEGRGNSFDQFENSELYQRAKGRYAVFFRLPKLSPKLAQKIDFNNMSFWAAGNNKELFSIGERQRVRTWLKRSYAALEAAVTDVDSAPDRAADLYSNDRQSFSQVPGQ